MKNEAVSIVIRSLNEKKELKRLLDKIDKQNINREVEVVIVDNESSDGTQAMLKGLKVKLVTIKKEDYTHPRSMNLGVSNCKHNIIILTVGHALPISNNWIEDGARHFNDPAVAGVYSFPIAAECATFIEKIFSLSGHVRYKMKLSHRIKKVRVGVLGATNCIIRKDLWEQNGFDETWESGGEDTQWAKWALLNNYKIIYDYRFTVKHSHGLHIIDFTKQYLKWLGWKKPQKIKTD